MLLPISFLVFSRRNRSKIPIALTIYGILCFVLLFFYHDLSKSQKKIYQSAYTLIEYSFFAYFFWYSIRNKKIRSSIVFASLFFLVFQIAFYFGTSLKRLDSIPIGIETILIFIYIFYFFFEFSKNLKGYYLYNHYCFWLSVGILIYLGGSFFFYLMINELTDDQVNAFGILTYAAEIVKNILFSAAIYISLRNPFEQTKSQKEIPFLDML